MNLSLRLLLVTVVDVNRLHGFMQMKEENHLNFLIATDL
jgi:hypothetical protein